MSDFLSFETFVTPRILRVVYLVLLGLIALGTLVRVVLGLAHLQLIGGVIVPLVAAAVSVVLLRIYCELVLVFFDMRDRLAEIAGKPKG